MIALRSIDGITALDRLLDTEMHDNQSSRLRKQKILLWSRNGGKERGRKAKMKDEICIHEEVLIRTLL